MTLIVSYTRPSSILSPFPNSYCSSLQFPLDSIPLFLPKKLKSRCLSFSISPALSSSHQTKYLISDSSNLLRLSSRYGDVGLSRALHASILKLDEQDTNMGKCLIVAYLKLFMLPDACKVFVSLPLPDVVSYTAIISALAKASRETEAVSLFFRMRESEILPNDYTFVAILTACIRLMDLHHVGIQIHAMVAKMGYLDCTFVGNALMGFYSKAGFFAPVHQLFDEMPKRDITSWNIAISSAVRGLMFEKAFEFLRDMQQIDDFKLDYFTISTLLSSATGGFFSRTGQEIHARSLRLGFESSLSVNNSLITFYARCGGGNLDNVVAVFKNMSVKDVITWTEMITAHVEHGSMDVAAKIFDEMPEKNSVSYNALLSGHSQACDGTKAIDFFLRMLEDGVELTDFTLSSAVKAWTILKDARKSEEIHGFIVKLGCQPNPFLESALVEMCLQCGRMEDGWKMFQRWKFHIHDENLTPLSSMMGGYVRIGRHEDAVSLLCSTRSKKSIDIDCVTSTLTLGICGTLGFLKMGGQIHCHALKSGFLADLGLGNSLLLMYCKCGNMGCAMKVFRSMPSCDVLSWNSLICGHLMHRQGEEALKLWSKMKNKGVKPDGFTFELIISSYRYTNSNLINECYELLESMKSVYEIDPQSDHYAAMIGVLGYWNSFDEAEALIKKESLKGFKPDASIWRALLNGSRIRSNSGFLNLAARTILDIETRDPAMVVLQSNLYSAIGLWHRSETMREELRVSGFKKLPGRSWIILDNSIHSFFSRDAGHPRRRDIEGGLEVVVKECLKVGYVPDTSFVLQEVEEHQKAGFLLRHSVKMALTFGLLMTGRHCGAVRVVKNIRVCGDCHAFLRCVSVVTKREIWLRDSSGFHVFVNGHCSCKDYW